MTLDTWLRIGAIGLPLVGVPAIWRFKDKSPRLQRGLASVLFGLAGLAALALFLLNRHYACMLSTGRQNCLGAGLVTLSLLLLNAVFATVCAVPRDTDKQYDYILMLMLSSAWAGMGLAENLLVLLIFLNLFFYVVYKWLDRKGLGWGFFIVRNDYSDDRNHYHDDPK
jgi:formate hydrogenlyase subunit 3/multisubunit Na+/H+ antiporter MnhD subunit